MALDVLKWIEKGRHLPRFLRDFHDQKDVFKLLAQHQQNKSGDPYHVPWTNAQVYTIDVFLRVMAACGWTLQRAPKGREYMSLADEIRKMKDQEADVLLSFLAQNKAGKEGGNNGCRDQSNA